MQLASVPVGMVMFFVFLGLKLSGAINWSWLWVTSPLWISAAIGVAMLLVVVYFLGKVRNIIGRIDL